MCEDPHWKEYSGQDECKLHDPHYLVRKLCELLQDEAAKNMIHRHVILIDGYLRNSTDGFFLSDLSWLMIALDRLSERLSEVREFRPALTQLLERCRLPPRLEKSSDVLSFAPQLQQYFTLLGYLVAALHLEPLQLLALEVLHCLLTSFLHRRPPARVGLARCLAAMEQSLLPATLAQLIEVAPPSLLPRLLSLALICANASPTAAKKMVCERALDAVFFRLDPQFGARDMTLPPDEAALRMRLPRAHDELAAAACALLWALLGALRSPDHTCLCQGTPSQQALWCLGFLFRYETLRGNLRRRNDLAGIITLAQTVLPGLLIVESNIAGDMIMLSVGSEAGMAGMAGMAGTWAEGVTFAPCVEDVHFKRMLLLAVCHLLQRPACAELFAGTALMPGLLELLLPRRAAAGGVAWTPAQLAKLAVYALRTLSLLVPVLEEQFLLYRGPARLVQLVRWSPGRPVPGALLLTLVRALAKILAAERPPLVDAFRRQGAVDALLAVCEQLVGDGAGPEVDEAGPVCDGAGSAGDGKGPACDGAGPAGDGARPPALTGERQRVLTLALLVLEILVRNHEPGQRACADAAQRLVRSCCARVVHPLPEDTCTDHRMLIALVDFLWEAVVWSPDSHRQFVAEGGVYALLDTMQCAEGGAGGIFLSALCDMVEQGACVVHLVTWRAPGGRGYEQQLAAMWRTEETQRRANRTPDGIMADIEMPLMGEAQWYHTYYRKKAVTVSPAIADLFGSVRPKVYSILQVLGQRHADRVDLAQAHYRMDYRPLATHDKITLELAANFLALKMGEVWAEVAMDVQTLNMKPIGAVSEVVSIMSKRRLQWASTIQRRQREALLAARRKEAAEERAFYRGQSGARLAPTLEALRELDYVARTSDREFRAASKARQKAEVDGSLQAPDDPNICRHRTYLPDINVTKLVGQSMHVVSVGKKEAPAIEQCATPSQESQIDDDDLDAEPDDCV